MKHTLKVFLLGIGLLFLNQAVKAQMLEPVKWTFSIEYLSNNEAWVVAQGKIDDHWHIYDIEQTDPLGPLPTVLKVNPSADYELIGSVVSRSKYIEEEDPVFEMTLRYFEGEPAFAQKIKLKKALPTISGSIEYQACDEEKCTFPDPEEFELKIKAGFFKAISSSSEPTDDETEPAKNSGLFKVSTPIDEDAPLEKHDGLVDPVSWSFEAEKSGENEITIIATPILQDGWHLYADLGNDKTQIIPTKIKIEEADGKVIGSAEVIPKPEVKLDPVFNEDLAYIEKGSVIKQKVQLLKAGTVLSATVTYQACDASQCLPPEDVLFNVDIKEEWFTNTATITSSNDEESTSKSNSVAKGESFWSIFIKGFGGGLLALLTPCVFPMMPMTVSFFTKQSSKRSKGISNALLYGLSIILIYVLIGFTITKTAGSDGLNAMASGGIANLMFFIIFTIFGASFLGAFEISLPSWIVNKSVEQEDKGGLIGIFFMAFTLALVSFSCTGPIIGSLLVLAAQGGNDAGPLIGMFGFSLALALPFTLFALFPSWLNSLPKSGGWLNSVKVVLGLLEFALALKFLSNVDLAYHWGILTREIFISLWVIIFIIIGLYLIGKLKFSHDSELPFVSVPRIVFAIFAFSFALYLIPGLFGAPLKLMSGLAPPRNYVEDKLWMRRGLDYPQFTAGEGQQVEKVDAHAECPNNLPCTKDYETGLAYAKEHNKPIFLDFTGYTCVNCRKMEDNVWIDPEVDRILRNEYVVISLYVDDKDELPESEQVDKELFGKIKKIRTIGNKWSYMQASRYSTNTQPYYVLLDTNEKLLIEDPIGYTPDAAEYAEYLLKGVEEFKKRN